jgi:glutathionyl-hydroquinone reductase
MRAKYAANPGFAQPTSRVRATQKHPVHVRCDAGYSTHFWCAVRTYQAWASITTYLMQRLVAFTDEMKEKDEFKPFVLM